MPFTGGNSTFYEPSKAEMKAAAFYYGIHTAPWALMMEVDLQVGCGLLPDDAHVAGQSGPCTSALGTLDSRLDMGLRQQQEGNTAHELGGRMWHKQWFWHRDHGTMLFGKSQEHRSTPAQADKRC